MPAAIPLALIGSAVGGVASAAIGSSAAKSAANAGVDAANHAADLQHQDAQQALDFNKQQYGNSLNLMSPYYNMGTASLGRLGYLMGLSPQTGLPGGVINPNAPASTATQGPGGGGQFNRFNFAATPAGGANPLASDPSLGTLPAGRPQFQRFQAEGAGAPVTASGNGQVPMAQPGQTSLPGGGFGVNPQNPDPNDPSAISGNGNINGGINPGGPDGLMNPGAAGTATASANQGGTGQVPRIDGGGLPGQNPPDSGPGSFGSLAQNFGEKWQAPTGVTEVNDPGYQFRIQQGLQALQNSAAARGKLVSGDTAKGLNDYAQNSASGEFQNVYNRSLNDYTTRYNAFNQDQNTQFNRFATLSGIGQTAAGQLSNVGLGTAGLNSNILLNSGQQIGQDLQNAGAARGSGYVGSANAITGGINGISNIAALLALMNKGTGSSSGSSSAGMGVI